MQQPWIEPDTAALLERMARDFADSPANPTVAERRAGLARAAALYGPEPAPVARIEDWVIDGPDAPVLLRIYWPEGLAAPAPVLVNMHGGGWVLGDPDSYERVARAYCAASGAIVVDVDYRRAPEHKHPAALRDCMTAVEWVHAEAHALGGDPRRIVVTGDSAGGLLAALTAQQTAVPLAGQILVYPVCTASQAAMLPSRAWLGDGRYFLRESDIIRAEEEYFADPADKEDVGASPLLATAEALTGLPPALIITASLDPLVDEGALYAGRLAEAGAPTDYRCAEGTIHGFILFAGAIDLGSRHIAEIGRWVSACPPAPSR